MELEKEKVFKAVSALLKVIKKDEKSELIDEPKHIQFQFTFRKIPKIKNKTLKLKLPYSCQVGSQEVCLFVKDLRKKDRDYEPTVRFYKDVLEKHGVTAISEVIPLKCLSLEHKTYEARRVLAKRFDVFLADHAILRRLPSALGKAFFGDKKIPLGVNMAAHNLKWEVESKLKNTQCYISGKGSTSVARIGHSKMEADKIADNVIDVARQIANGIPGGAANIKCIYVKTSQSVAIPVFLNTATDEVILPVEDVKQGTEDTEFEEITTLEGKKVKVTPYGDVKVISNKRKAENNENSTNAKKKKNVNSKPGKNVPGRTDVKEEKHVKKVDKTVKKVDEPVKKVNEPVKKVGTPGKKVNTPGKKVDTPGKKVDKPGKKLDTPGKKVDTPGKKVDTPGKKVDTPGKKVEEPVKTVDEPVKKVPGKKVSVPGKKVKIPEKVAQAGVRRNNPRQAKKKTA